MALSAANANHWNAVNDPTFPSCLEAFKMRHEASLASRRSGGQGESSTPTWELPLVTWPQPPPTPTLGWWEVDEKVAEVLDQVHSLQLEMVLRTVDASFQTSTALPSQNVAVEAALHKYREVAQLRLALPLTHLDVVREEIEKFIQFCLEELQSQQETKNLVGELSSKITDHRGRVRQLLRSESLRHPEVIPLVLVGMAAD